MQQITCQTRARSSLLTHPRARRRLHSKDAVLPLHVARHRYTSLAAVRGRGTTASVLNRAATGIVGGRFCGSGGVVVSPSLGGAAVGFLCVGGSGVPAVEGGVLAEVVVVGWVGFVAGACRRG